MLDVRERAYEPGRHPVQYEGSAEEGRYLHLYPGRPWLQQYFYEGARFIFHAPPLSDKNSMREAINGAHTFEQLLPDF